MFFIGSGDVQLYVIGSDAHHKIFQEMTAAQQEVATQMVPFVLFSLFLLSYCDTMVFVLVDWFEQQGQNRRETTIYPVDAAAERKLETDFSNCAACRTQCVFVEYAR
jgi:hypothetical protein